MTGEESSATGGQASIEQIKLDLLSLVSHELRTPLSLVLNAVRLARESDLPATEREKFLEMAHRNAERLNETLSQLLDLSKLVSGRLVCRLQETALEQLVEAKIDRYKNSPLLGKRDFQVRGPLRELPVILGDAPRLEKVLQSLLENAARFSPAGSLLALEVRPRVAAGQLPAGLALSQVSAGQEFVLITVTNAVDAQAAKRGAEGVFKVFGQKEKVLDRAHEGVGGSLAIGAEVARQHGGAMHAAVEGGKFTVWLALPVLRSEAALLKVLESRMFALQTQIGALSVVVFETEPGQVEPVQQGLKNALFRASDSVYSVGERGEVVVLMDDCKKADAPKIVRRLLSSLGAESARILGSAKVGLSHCPEDATDPGGLLSQARRRLVPLSEF